MNSPVYERHPFSYAWPEMTASDGAAVLTASIQRHGFRKDRPIVLFEGRILDGWNRYRAALAAGVEPIFREFEGNKAEAITYAETENSARRQMTKSQQAAAFASIDLHRPPEERRSASMVAALTGASPSTVAKVFRLIEGDPETADAIASGQSSVDAVARAKGAGKTGDNAFMRVSAARQRRLEEAARARGLTKTQALSKAIDDWVRDSVPSGKPSGR